jgi:SLOG-like protein
VLVTGMGNARNNVIVLSADVVVACGVDSPGTASEVALALKNGKLVILLAAEETSLAFFRHIGEGKVMTAATPQEAVALIRSALP